MLGLRRLGTSVLALALVCSCRAPEDGEGGEDEVSAETSTSTDSTDSTSTGGDTDTNETTEDTGSEPEPGWVATWAASPTAASPLTAAPIELADQSLRQVARVSLGGELVRVRLANTFGEEAIAVTEARLALSGEGSAIEASSDRPLTVEGAASFVLPAGQIVVTDPVELEVAALGDLSVSLYFAEPALTTTVHAEAAQTSWLSAGNLSADATWPGDAATTTSSYWLNGVEVLATLGEGSGAVVALGDSLTDGSGSTVDGNGRWPNRLAERFQAKPETADLAVVNAGIGGNCVLRDFIGPKALDRFERDVLDQPGVAWVIVFEGINDIGVGSVLNQLPTPDALIDGYLELIDEAHARGLVVHGATLLPYEGADYYTEDGEAVRQAVNEWIRTSGAFDAVHDFDAVIRDPGQPTRVLPDYDVGDHLHLNDAGYAALGDSIDLTLFE